MIVNLHEAKTHLSRLVERAASGEDVIIAKAGRPLVRLIPIDDPAPIGPRRLGFLTGLVQIPDDFDTMGEAAIAASFEGEDLPSDAKDL
ncbi:type II toxin-antitoxin system Phd/YefM family antitoxin [Mongoliimonas terrestris]|uniref:type II toxin-antitoxin system Phd/YefM family antitoxin n=1 Tax=Mongoliimonas terrestris TaxID=1709001 RepID=UPI00094985B3|nr:type II toxin-antitoxin system prevent-host-death family antitoxin [Mongoliimonas terrestris]